MSEVRENGETHPSSTRSDENNAIWIVKLIVEIIVLQLQWIYYTLESVYHLIVSPEEADVSGEIVLITGTGHGIGKETALQYARLGAVVVCVDLNEPANLETVRQIESEGGKAHHFVCDVANRSAVFDLAKAVQRSVGVVTILVNNAGIMPTRPLLQQTEAEIRKTFDINVLANFWCIQALLPDMIAQKKGHIVALCSVAGLAGLKNLAPYCSTKFAVRGYMESLSEELRLTAPQIKFTTIYPYMVDTGLCKRPHIRFPAINQLLTPELVADTIVASQRRGLQNVSIPRYFAYVESVTRLYPLKCAHLLADFLNTGVDPDA